MIGKSGQINVTYIAVDDLEKNDGSVDKPYFMSKSLLAVYGNKNAAPPQEDDSKHDVKEFASRVLSAVTSSEQPNSKTDLKEKALPVKPKLK